MKLKLRSFFNQSFEVDELLGFGKKGNKFNSIQFSVVRANDQVEENATKRPQTQISMH